jgi:SP family arabinose:H+ symporter-like MFS transporter
MEAVQPTSAGLQIEGSNLYMVSICSVAALGAVMFGFDIAIISGAGPFVQQYFSLSEIAFGWGVSSLIVGCMVGALFAGRAADRYGRRATLLSIALVFSLTSVATGLAHSFTFFVVARICGGIAVGAASMISPLYIAEISPSAIRGRMVALNQLGITFGILVSYLINYLLRGWGINNWRWMFVTGALPSVAFFVFLLLVPESPRWLARSGKRDAALKILTKIGGAENAALEIASIDRAEPTSGPAAEPRELLSPRFRRVVVVGALLAILVQISGINTVITYAPIILRSAGNGLDAAIFQTFVVGIINFAFTFVAVLGVDRFGRKALYIAGSAGMCVSLILLSIGFLHRVLRVLHRACVLDPDGRNVSHAHPGTRDVLGRVSVLGRQLSRGTFLPVAFVACGRFSHICLPRMHGLLHASGCVEARSRNERANAGRN